MSWQCNSLHPIELINLPTQMLSFYTDADGIPEYINMQEDAQRKLEWAKLPMSNEQLLAITTTLLGNRLTWQLPLDCTHGT